MTQKSLFDFVVRGLLLLCIHVCQQLPKQYEVQVDRDRFLGAFTMRQDNREKHPSAWKLGPDGPVRQADPSTRMQAIRHMVHQAYIALYQFFAKAMPMVSGLYTATSDVSGECLFRPVPKGCTELCATFYQTRRTARSIRGKGETKAPIGVKGWDLKDGRLGKARLTNKPRRPGWEGRS